MSRLWLELDAETKKRIDTDGWLDVYSWLRTQNFVEQQRFTDRVAVEDACQLVMGVNAWRYKDEPEIVELLESARSSLGFLAAALHARQNELKES